MSSAFSEASLIARVRDAFEGQVTQGARELRDDCAILSPLPPAVPNAHRVISCDQMWRGRHFATYEPGEVVGARAVVRAASDIEAAGGTPRELMWAFMLDGHALRGAAHESFFDRFLAGAAAACRDNDIELSGGDITAGETFGVALTIVGTVSGTPLTRSGATAGDDIYISAPTGLAASHRARCDAAGAFVADAREGFAPRLSGLGPALVGIAKAATDVSDGLVHDLSALLEPARLGATLFAPVLLEFGPRLEDVLYGGDDYVLLWTQRPDSAALVKSIRIGVVGGENLGIQGEMGRKALSVRGYDPFV